MEDKQVYGLEEVRGGFLVLLDGFTQVGNKPWCSRSLRRVLVAALIRWATARAGTICGLEWTSIGLHTLHA